MQTNPLHNKRIIITRPQHQAEPFAAALRERGAQPIVMPLIATQAVPDVEKLDAQLVRIMEHDWVIFTSANGFRYVKERLEAAGIDLCYLRIAVVGKATAQALQATGCTPDFVPSVHTAEALAQELIAQEGLAGSSILLAQGNLAPPTLADLLRAAGATVQHVEAYQTVHLSPAPQMLQGGFDVITFTSSSAVVAFCEGLDDPATVLGQTVVACIGPVTAQTAAEKGLPVQVVAQPHTVPGLIDALADYYNERIQA